MRVRPSPCIRYQLVVGSTTGMKQTVCIGKLHYLPNKTLSSVKLRKSLRGVGKEIGEGDDFDFGIAAGWFWKCSSGEADQRCNSRMSQGLTEDFPSNEACGS